MKALEATRWWTRAGVQTLEQLARLTGRRRLAQASHGGCHNFSCCCLVHEPISPSACISNCNNNPNFHLRSWLCCGAGSRIFFCGECIRTSFSGCADGQFVSDYLCSYGVREAFSC